MRPEPGVVVASVRQLYECWCRLSCPVVQLGVARHVLSKQTGFVFGIRA